ncbi:MAG: hypothetical protein M1281_04750 [Chloroflexi bacterium]|nr:hypothetical protein [Chloroflexota bacterium]
MSDKSWKAHERRIAHVLGTQRTGPVGREGPDAVTDWLAVECKHRDKLPEWMSEALAKIRQQAGSERLGIVVLHQAGSHDSVVMLSFKDFTDWFDGKAPLDNDQ